MADKIIFGLKISEISEILKHIYIISIMDIIQYFCFMHDVGMHIHVEGAI